MSSFQDPVRPLVPFLNSSFSSITQLRQFCLHALSNVCEEQKIRPKGRISFSFQLVGSGDARPLQIIEVKSSLAIVDYLTVDLLLLKCVKRQRKAADTTVATDKSLRSDNSERRKETLPRVLIAFAINIISSKTGNCHCIRVFGVRALTTE